MDTRRALQVASNHLLTLAGHSFDVLDISKPISLDAALNLAKVISKLSPLLGNLIEFNTVEFLNKQPEFGSFGAWIRQDPGFPDAVFRGSIDPAPGFEIKAWFPLATELTARFRDSQNHFLGEQTNVCMVAWLPGHLIYGKPYILDVVVVSGYSVAKARDEHYHRPPDYLVLEPQDTRTRTRNLQQTNTTGHKWQGSPAEFTEAQKIVESWGEDGNKYKPTTEYQSLLRELTSRFTYRLDTNYAKVDRIVHPEIEAFKTKVYNTDVNGMSVRKWLRLLGGKKRNKEKVALIKAALEERLQIREEGVGKLLA
ncbi:MAG: hypothetical protein ABSD98_04515 [Candidatus Korobacteraceae bacterium]|jgi:hypothetical protein